MSTTARAKGVFSDPVKYVAKRIGLFLAEKHLTTEATKYLLAGGEYTDQVEHFCGMLHIGSLDVSSGQETLLPDPLCGIAPSGPELRQTVPPVVEVSESLGAYRARMLDEFATHPLYVPNYKDGDFFLRRAVISVGGENVPVVAIGTGRCTVDKVGVVNVNCSVSGHTTATLPDSFFPDEHKSPEFCENNGVKRWIWVLKLAPGVHIRLWANLNNGERGRDIHKTTFAVTAGGFRVVSSPRDRLTPLAQAS